MKALISRALPLYAAGLWWGSLTAVGFIVVPVLFSQIEQRAMAGYVAAQVFAAQTWISVACALVLLVLVRNGGSGGWTVARARTLVSWVLGGLLLALVVQYGVSPRIVARQNVQLWHSVATGLYAAQWLCAGAALWLAAQTPANRTLP